MKRWTLLLCLILVPGFAMVQAQAPYGVGDNINVPYVAPGTLTLDGKADEPAWNDAANVNMIGFWDGAWGGVPYPDIEANAKLLWTEDWLYIFAKVDDYSFYFGSDSTAWTGEQIMVGVDRILAGDPPGGQFAPDWSGAPYNAPDKGPVVYKIYDKGITLNWGGWWDDANQTYWQYSPVDSGWVDGKVFVDNDNFVWGVEMKIKVPQIALGTRIGFNIGGAAATPDTTAVPWSWGEGTYAYYTWHPQPADTAVGYPSDYIAGDIQRRAKSFGTLTFKQSITGVYETDRSPAVPSEFSLAQNYPNPFNPTTTVSYQLKKDAKVQIQVYNVLGKQVATLVDRKENAGIHAVKWNGSELASGLYFIQLRVNDQLVASRKAMLLK